MDKIKLDLYKIGCELDYTTDNLIMYIANSFPEGKEKTLEEIRDMLIEINEKYYLLLDEVD